MNINKSIVTFDGSTKYILDDSNDRYMVTWKPDEYGLYTFCTNTLDELRNVLMNKDCKHTDNVIDYFKCRIN